MRLLLYCTKAKPYLMNLNTKYFISSDRESLCYIDKKDMKNFNLNGYIVAECDYEVEEIYKVFDSYGGTKTYYKFLEKQSCLSKEEMDKYLKGKEWNTNTSKPMGYGIHIKNLHIFDKPRELSEYHIPYGCINISCERKTKQKYLGCSLVRHCKITQIKKAPQNMMKVESKICDEKDYILISIRPEWLCKILNKEKTIEIRKKVLKEML